MLCLRKKILHGRNGRFLAVQEGFFCIAVWRPKFSLFRDESFPARGAACRAYSAGLSGLGKASGGNLQGAESLVNQGEERFERICRAEFNVDTPDAGPQARCNFKESQTNLAHRGSFEFGAT